MQKIVEFTLAQRVFFNLLFVLLMVIGAFILLDISVERYPNIEFGKMTVNSYFPGASPEEVERLVSKKLEEALEEVEDIDFVTSFSYRERSSVVIKFTDDSDYRRRFDDVRLKILTILGELPETVEPPVFNFLDVNDWFPAISVNISGPHENTSLVKVAKELKTELQQLPGVRLVRLRGEFDREFHLLLAKEKLLAARLSYHQVEEAIRASNVSIPAGYLTSREGEIVTRVDEQVTGRTELLDIVVRSDGDGSFIRLADLVEEAFFSYRDPFIMTSVDGRDSVTLQVFKEVDANAVAVASKVRALVEKDAQTYLKSEVLLRVTQDSSLKIKDSMRVLGVNLAVGICLVCLIIWLFMGLRNAALTTIGIPFAFLVTTTLMYLTGKSINEVSLFAFILVSGIIVDDAIVVVENIYRHLQQGKERKRAIVDGCSEVFMPVVSATLTTVVAFLPMLIMTGMVGDFFAIVPITICYALLASLLECLFILPCHLIEFGPSRVAKGHGAEVVFAGRKVVYASDGRGMRFLRNLFHRMILAVLCHRRLVLVLLFVFFLGAMLMFISSVLGRSNLVRITFFPDDYSLYYAEITAPVGTPIETTHGLVKTMAAEIVAQGEGEAESALGYAGYYISEDFSPRYGNHLGYLAVTLPPLRERRFADYPVNDVNLHLDRIRKLLGAVLPEDVVLSVRPEKDGPPVGKDLNIRILGSQAESVAALAEKTQSFLADDPRFSPYLVDLGDDSGRLEKIVDLRLDHEQAAVYGLLPHEVLSLAAAATAGRPVGEMKLGEENIDIRLKLGGLEQKELAEILDAVVVTGKAGSLRLGDLASLEFSEQPASFARYQGQRAVTLTADIKAGAPVNGAMVVQAVEEFYQTIRDHYPGASLSFAGEYESTRESFTSLAYAFVVAVVMIYLILSAQFRSALQPMVVIAAVVFALIGVIWGTALARTLFTVNSFVAVIGVAGVVVNDSLVLVQFLNVCHRQGIKRRQALLQATHIRLRPILLTTLTTTLGLLPMALGIPEYSTIWGSMAMTFVTGLCTATLLTIIIIPLLWDMVTPPLSGSK